VGLRFSWGVEVGVGGRSPPKALVKRLTASPALDVTSDIPDTAADSALVAKSDALDNIADATTVAFATIDALLEKTDGPGVFSALDALMLLAISFIAERDKDKEYVVGT
jgi:hypothetical protein